MGGRLYTHLVDGMDGGVLRIEKALGPHMEQAAQKVMRQCKETYPMNNNSNEPGAGMNAMTPFQFESHAVRTVVDDHGEVWFVGTDVATVLGYANPHKALMPTAGVCETHTFRHQAGFKKSGSSPSLTCSA